METQAPSRRKFSVFTCFCSALFLTAAISTIAFVLVYSSPMYATLSYTFFITRAELNYANSNYQKAILDFSRAIDIKPDSVNAYTYRGKAYALDENYPNAKQDLEMAIKLDPSFSQAYNSLCWYGSLLGDAINVLRVCEQAVMLEPNNPHYRDSRGVARALTGDYMGAILDFRFYVIQAGIDSSTHQVDILQREQWISALSQGVNPFNSAKLHELLDNDDLPNHNYPHIDI